MGTAEVQPVGCEDSDVIGSMFYIMEFCEGNVHWESSLEDISSNQLRAKMYDEMSRVMAAIHSVDLDKVGLSDYGRPGNYFQRQYDRWSSQYKASELKPIPEMDQVIEWLGKNIPEDDGRVSLVHGDYRLDNLMFSSDNERVIAVLDWELSTLGHPYADLAYQCMGMRLPSGNGPGASSVPERQKDPNLTSPSVSVLASECAFGFYQSAWSTDPACGRLEAQQELGEDPFCQQIIEKSPNSTFQQALVRKMNFLKKVQRPK